MMDKADIERERILLMPVRELLTITDVREQRLAGNERIFLIKAHLEDTPMAYRSLHTADPWKLAEIVMEPTVAAELEDRAAQRDKIAALFRLHPLEDIEADVLKTITPHYHQRISELRRHLNMTIQNRRRNCQDGSGRTKRLDGAYRWLPDGEPLGRSADTVIAAGWSTKHSRLFEQPFVLTSPTGKADV